MAAPLRWQLATVRSIATETERTKTITLTLPAWVMHQPGQHYDVRLTAPDGYRAQRSYSIASEPERRGEIDLTVERISDGEVSPYLHDVLALGDQLEVRGPIGGYFVWTADLGGPLLLIGGGSGVVPLMSMIRHRIAAGSDIRTRLLLSSRTIDDIIYRAQLEESGRRLPHGPVTGVESMTPCCVRCSRHWATPRGFIFADQRCSSKRPPTAWCGWGCHRTTFGRNDSARVATEEEN